MFGRRKRQEPGESPQAVYVGLRQSLLGLDPAEVGLNPGGSGVWAGMMDMGYPGRRWATLVVVADGTVSLYTSAGGGIIGAGAHPNVRAAGDQWLAALDHHVDLLPAVDPAPLPPEGQVTIRALRYDGQRSVTAAEDDLGHGRHPAAALFHAAHEVITQLRETSEHSPGR
jgi:hypothetical protein